MLLEAELHFLVLFHFIIVESNGLQGLETFFLAFVEVEEVRAINEEKE